jgi:hypothetical protein
MCMCHRLLRGDCLFERRGEDDRLEDALLLRTTGVSSSLESLSSISGSSISGVSDTSDTDSSSSVSLLSLRDDLFRDWDCFRLAGAGDLTRMRPEDFVTISSSPRTTSLPIAFAALYVIGM